jgi:phage-related protein
VQCHGADTGLAAQCYTAAGMASPRELVELRRDVIPGRAKVAACVLRYQGIKCSYTGAGAQATCVQVSSSEADPARGGV